MRRSFHSHGDTVPVLRGVDLVVRRRDAVGIRGSSGAGKSTLLSILSLLDQGYDGTYRFADRDVASASSGQRQEWRLRRIGIAAQDLWLVSSLTAHENLLVPLLAAGKPASDARARVDRLLERAGIAHCADRRPSQVSGGERRRIALARSLVNEPELLVLDEPTAELDESSAAAVRRLIADAHVQGATLIVASHDPQLLGLCGSHFRLDDGRLRPDGEDRPTSRQDTNPKAPLAYD